MTRGPPRDTPAVPSHELHHQPRGRTLTIHLSHGDGDYICQRIHNTLRPAHIVTIASGHRAHWTQNIPTRVPAPSGKAARSIRPKWRQRRRPRHTPSNPSFLSSFSSFPPSTLAHQSPQIVGRWGDWAIYGHRSHLSRSGIAFLLNFTVVFTARTSSTFFTLKKGGKTYCFYPITSN